ncbi:MAG: hypothetical protein OXG68_02245 [Chloroflexi bacterium]|nr:hypothetical protein [Chloroflexota bacterium]
MVSTALLLKAECRLGTAKLIIDKAKEAIGAGDNAAEISESTPDIPAQYIAAFISERSILFDEADALMAAFLTRVEKPFLYDAWTKHIGHRSIPASTGGRRPDSPNSQLPQLSCHY